MTVKTEPAETEPAEAEPAEAEPAEAEPAEAEPAETEPSMEDLVATVQAMGRQLDDMSAAITAIANQGSVNASIERDNRETGEEEYPTIDIDGINRLLGV